MGGRKGIVCIVGGGGDERISGCLNQGQVEIYISLLL